MKKILLVHGPNLNNLGKRDPEHYGTMSLDALAQQVTEWAREKGVEIIHVQSNHEGVLIDEIQKNAEAVDGIIINAGALTHYSYALHDALVDTHLPAVEVHLSDVHSREAWRAVSVLEPACIQQISGKGPDGYHEALDVLLEQKVVVE